MKWKLFGLLVLSLFLSNGVLAIEAESPESSCGSILGGALSGLEDFLDVFPFAEINDTRA